MFQNQVRQYAFAVHAPLKEINEAVESETNSKAKTSNESTVSESTTASSELAANSEVNVKATEAIERESISMMNDNIPEGFIAFNDHYYYGYSYGISWEEAESYCSSLGGHLISINSVEKQELALEIAKSVGKDNIWTGGYYSNGRWG